MHLKHQKTRRWIRGVGGKRDSRILLQSVTKLAAMKWAVLFRPEDASRKYTSCPDPSTRVDPMTVVIPRTIADRVYMEYKVPVVSALRCEPPRATAPNRVKNMSRKRSFAERAASSMFRRHSVSS